MTEVFGKVCTLFFILILSQVVISTTITGVPEQVCGLGTFTVNGTDLVKQVTVLVASNTPDVVITPSIFSLSSTVTSASITIICKSITPYQITFTDALTKEVIGSGNSLCKGLMYITNPITSILRDSDFSLNLHLEPSPLSRVDVSVVIDNPIVVPGSDMVNFGVHQEDESVIFYVPNGDVGETNIFFDSRSLYDYGGPNCERLELSIDVLGTITTDLASLTIGDGVYTVVTVEIHPPAGDTLTVAIDASVVGKAVPSTLTFEKGQDKATFKLLPQYDDPLSPASIVFTSEYYDTLTEYFFVVGTIFTATPPVINTFATQDLVISILPGSADTEIVIDIASSSNVQVVSSITFPPGVTLLHYTLNALAEGDGFLTFTSPGYISQTDRFVIRDVDCTTTETVNSEGTLCVSCPVFRGAPCSGNGTCSFSTFSKYQARCVCNEGYFGGYCEFTTGSVEVFPFTSTGSSVEYPSIPGVLTTTVIIPSEVVNDNNPVNGGNGTFYIQGYHPDTPFNKAVDPTVHLPNIPNYTAHALVSGFGIDITLNDNTLYDILDNPITVIFDFDPSIITQTDYLEMKLFYWNNTIGEWVYAPDTCPEQDRLYSEDFIDLSLSTHLCVLGQYQFFALVPVPIYVLPPNQPAIGYLPKLYDDESDEVYQFPTTGITGIQQPLPPQPHLVPAHNADPSPPKNDYLEDNNSNIIGFSSLLIVCCIALFL